MLAVHMIVRIKDFGILLHVKISFSRTKKLKLKLKKISEVSLTHGFAVKFTEIS